MAQIALARLKLTVPDAALVMRGRRLAEEALRCAGVDGGARYLVIRKVRLGALPGGEGAPAQRAWTERTAFALHARAGAAVHALAAGAEAADAVWFSSEADARAALVLLLVRGRRPQAWFWRLAVPEWNGGNWAIAAPALLRTLAALPGGRPALARVVVTALLSGDGPVLLAAIGDALAATLSPPSMPEDGMEPTLRSSPGSARSQPETSESAVGVAARHAVARVLLASPSSLRSALGPALAAVGPMSPRARFLATQVVLAAAPELAATPHLLSAAVTELAREAGSNAAAPVIPIGRVTPAAVPVPSQSLNEVTAARALAAAERVAGRSVDPVAPAAAPAHAPMQDVDRPGSQRPTAFPVCDIDERRSHGAGLFLLIRPLAWLGLPAWLQCNPRHAATGFGWILLRRIAARMRIAAEDPIWALLNDACDEAMDAGLDHDAAVDAWRIGLDRWLRRRVRITLAATVCRAGWLLADQAQVTIRFPLDAADIRLRRLALDVDPGWVPWLGRTVAYLYRDAPAARDGRAP